MGVLETIANASAATKEVTLCLDAELQADFDRLTELVQKELRDSDDSLAMTGFVEARDQLQGCIEKMRASEVKFKFVKLDWLDKLKVQEDHPPREGNEADMFIGGNAQTYPAALIQASCKSLTDVSTGDTAPASKMSKTRWNNLFKKLNAGQIDRLFSTARFVNDGAPVVPTSALALLRTPAEDESSKQPEPGESPQDDSLAGNPPQSPNSTTTKTADSPP